MGFELPSSWRKHFQDRDLVRSIGADRVIDYTDEDFTKAGRRYDLIFDVAGNHSLSACKRALKPRGTLVLAGQTGRREHSIFPLLKARLLAPFVRYRLRSFIAKRKKEDLNTVKEYLQTGKIAPMIDRTYPLREVPEAMRYLGTLHARGKVVITMDSRHWASSTARMSPRTGPQVRSKGGEAVIFERDLTSFLKS